MTFEKILLTLIAISFLGFMAGLIGKNTGNRTKKTLRSTEIYSVILSVSVSILLLAAVVYSIFYT